MDDTTHLDERTLKYGRNTMAIAGVIIVLALVPGIEICEFEPLGFRFSPESQKTLWVLLGIVLAYYSVHFAVGVWIDFPLRLMADGKQLIRIPWCTIFWPLKWAPKKRKFGKDSSISADSKERKIVIHLPAPHGNHEVSYRTLLKIRHTLSRLIVLDLILPTSLIVVALYAGVGEYFGTPDPSCSELKELIRCCLPVKSS